MITPLDIRKLEFNNKMRGFDKEEVRTALDSIAEELEKQIKENKIISEKLNITEERLNHFKLIEKTLQDSVITMQTTLEEKKLGAEKEADLIIQEAKLKADSEMEDYIDKVKSLKSEVSMLEKQKMNYFIRFKSFLTSQMDWLKAMESPIEDANEDNIIKMSSHDKSEVKSASEKLQEHEKSVTPDNIEPFGSNSQMTN